MNKQQLAAKIWESANQMRSKIEANEYKDYILGFIFYKYLSDKLVRFAKGEDFSDAELVALSEEDTETVDHIKGNIGYFISYEHLFSTWIEHKGDFDVSHVRDALSGNCQPSCRLTVCDYAAILSSKSSSVFSSFSAMC